MSEWAEKIAAKTWFLVLFNVAIALGLWLGNVDITNIAISIISGDIMLLLVSGQRRGNVALHAKLDELIRTSNARNDLVGIEIRTEEEICAVRDAVLVTEEKVDEG